MVVSGLRLVNFRSYCDAEVRFGPGLNVVVGENAAGKTNLLEAAWFALRGSSPRTRRDEKLITWGERFARVELQAGHTGRRRAAGRRGLRAEPGQARALGRPRGRVAGRPARAQPGVHLRAREPVAGQGQSGAAARASRRLRRRARPAVRRRRARSAGRPAPAQRATRGRQERRRPGRARPVGRAVRPGRGASSGAAAATSSPNWPPGTPRPLRPWRPPESASRSGWSRNWRASATTRRPSLRNCARVGPERSAGACRCSGRTATTSSSWRSGRRRRRRAGPDGEREAGAGAAPARHACRPDRHRRAGVRPGGVAARWPRPAALRLAGGTARRRPGAAPRGAAPRRGAHRPAGAALPRRRHERTGRLPAAACWCACSGRPGQAIITTTNRHYFTDEELSRATVVELPLDGSLAAGAGGAAADDEPPPAPPDLDAL